MEIFRLLDVGCSFWLGASDELPADGFSLVAVSNCTRCGYPMGDSL